MTTGTLSIVITVALAVIAYIVAFFASLYKSKEMTTKLITDLKLEVVKEIGKVSSALTTETAVIATKIGYLEQKQDKHNALIEKTYKTESSVSSAHHRLDGVDKALIHIEEGVKNLEVDHAKMLGVIVNKKGER